MSIGLMLIQIFPTQLLSLFNASDEMIKIGLPALRIISIGYIFAGFSIVSSSVYQAFGNGIMSLIGEVSRQMVVLLPVAYFLSLQGNVNLIWWSYPIAETLALIINIVFLRFIFKKIIHPMTE
jgi:Na+-driven multidrug efflux pump